MTARPGTQQTLKAQLKVNDDDPDEVSAELTLSPYVDGPVFNPDPVLDAEPTGFLDDHLSIAATKVRMPPGSALQVKQHFKKVSYIHAARTRIFVARFRLLHSEFRSEGTKGDLLSTVAESGRLYQQTERLVIVARVVPFVVGVALISCVLVITTFRAAAALFDSVVPAFIATFFLIVGYAQGPSMFVGRTRKGPWQSALSAVIAIIFASPLVGAILQLPGSVPQSVVLKVFIFAAGAIAVSHLLTRAFEMFFWPLFGHRGGWLSRRIAFEGTLFYQLVDSAFLLFQGGDIDDVMSSIQDAGETARALHQAHDQQMLDRHSQEMMKARGDKIAATIWHHKYLLALPGYDVRGVACSLFNGAMSIYEEDWDNLSRIDPQVSVKSTVQRYAPRVLIAGLIAAVAFILPQTELISGDQASYVKATLLVAALFALFSSDTASLRDTAVSLTKDTFGKSA